MSEYFTFHEPQKETETEIQSLIKGIDLQINLMRMVKGQIESCAGIEKKTAPQVHEDQSRYGKSGYMADVELDEHGVIKAIRYDWVDP